jgi:hypothetical protein
MEYPVTQEDQTQSNDHLPQSFAVITQHGKVNILRNEQNVEMFEHLYSLWHYPTHCTEDMEAAVREYLGAAQADDPASVTLGDLR